MKPRTATWDEVRTGMYVAGRGGELWRVEDQRGGKSLLRNRDGARVAGVFSGSVVLMEPTADEALALVTANLGAEVTRIDVPGQVTRCPPMSHQLEHAHNHFFLMHGLWTKSGPGSRSIKRLIEDHVADHQAGGASHAYTAHEHHVL